MGKKQIFGWIAATGLGLAAIWHSQSHDQEKDIKQKEDLEQTHLRGGALSNPFGIIKNSEDQNNETGEKIASEDMSTPTLPQPSSAEKKEEEKFALFYFEKFKNEHNDYAKKFEYLEFAYDALGNNISKAAILGLTPRELAQTMRDMAARAIYDIKTQIPQSPLDILMQANNLRTAQKYSGLAEDGTYDELYAEQITGLKYDDINARKIQAALPAAREVVPYLRSLTPDIVNKMDDDEISRYLTMRNLVTYVVDSSELDLRRQERYEHIGIRQEEWFDLEQNISETLLQARKSRLEKSLPTQNPYNPASPHP